MKTKQPRTLTDQLRRAIAAGPKTRYQLAGETGIDQATLSRFVHGKGGLSLSGADRIAAALGLNLTANQATRPKA